MSPLIVGVVCFVVGAVVGFCLAALLAANGEDDY
jgi:hypothetical protein